MCYVFCTFCFFWSIYSVCDMFVSLILYELSIFIKCFITLLFCIETIYIFKHLLCVNGSCYSKVAKISKKRIYTINTEFIFYNHKFFIRLLKVVVIYVIFWLNTSYYTRINWNSVYPIVFASICYRLIRMF